MTFSEDVYRYMFAALQEAEKGLDINEVPIGAVIVYKNQIIGRGFNQVEMLRDPTAHAEMIAITAAANFLGNWRLNECDIFVTMEPCVMCTGALVSARINNLYFSIFDTKFGACGSVFNLCEDQRLNHKIKVYSGIYSKESEDLLKTFFEKLRNEKSNGNKD